MYLKLSQRKSPKLSLVLLDWGVRESFHLLHYLKSQTLPRDSFEVILVEYYQSISRAAQQFEEEIDTWVLLGMPPSHYYHKHLMYNVGIVLSRGEVIVICDSDAMVKPSFLESIWRTFEQNQNIVCHLDQYRNARQDLYPFSYPSFEEVSGPGCINANNGKTRGITATADLLHARNYGACFCAKKSHILQAGGADEHIDYVGHISGPYDLTFRLVNMGLKEIWHQTEFLYHTWHPGTDGLNNYLGPHDGYNTSSTAIEALLSGRTQPHLVNPLIARAASGDTETIQQEVISPKQRENTLRIHDRAYRKQTAYSSYLCYVARGIFFLKLDEQWISFPLALYQTSLSKQFSSAVNPTLTEVEAYLKQSGAPYAVHDSLLSGLSSLGGNIRFCLRLALMCIQHIRSQLKKKLERPKEATLPTATHIPTPRTGEPKLWHKISRVIPYALIRSRVALENGLSASIASQALQGPVLFCLTEREFLGCHLDRINAHILLCKDGISDNYKDQIRTAVREYGIATIGVDKSIYHGLLPWMEENFPISVVPI